MSNTIKSTLAPFEHKVKFIRGPFTARDQIPHDECDIELENGTTLRYNHHVVTLWQQGQLELWEEDTLPVYYMKEETQS